MKNGETVLPHNRTTGDRTPAAVSLTATEASAFKQWS